MTVSTSTNRADYPGNGVTTSFPVPFYFIDPTNLLVLSTVLATGVSTTLVLNSDYTVAGAGVSAGGTLTTTVAPASTVKISIMLNLAFVQAAHYVPNDPFPAASHEAALDYVTLLAKQTAEQFGRAVQVPAGETGLNVVLPPAISRANTFPFFDAQGNLTTSAIASINGQFATYVAPGITQILNVPANFGSISAALAALAGWVIHGTVQIKVADGTYTSTSSITVAHPFGENIHIIGNVTTPSNCLLNFSASDGFYVPPGFLIGEINGFRIAKTGTKANLGCGTDGGAYLKLGPNVEIDNFYYGIASRNRGYVNAGGTATNFVKVTNGGDVGIWAYVSSFVNCEFADVSLCADAPNNLGGGIVAEFSSAIEANMAKTHGNFLCGLSALQNSAIRAWSVQSYGNSQGLVTGSRGMIEVFNQSGAPTIAQIINNTNYGHYCSDSYGGVFGLSSALTTGNGTGVEAIGFKFASDGSTKAYSGSVTVDSNGPAQVTGGSSYFDLDAPITGFSILRALAAGVEKGRIQYNHAGGEWEISAGAFNVTRAVAATGKMTIGRGAPATNSTTGHLQIPVEAGAPTGTVSDVQTGYVPIVFDSTNSKLWVYVGGAWKGVVLT